MTAARAETRVTPEQYLAAERQAQTKSEYLGGFVVAMTGASRLHNYVAGDIFVELYRQLRDGPCELFANDMRVKVAELDTLLNPIVIIEVLSPSTERHDRGAKFASYRQISTLGEYMLVAQDRPSVEHYIRQGEQWILTAVTGIDASVTLPAIGCELHLRDVYRRVTMADRSNPAIGEGHPHS